MGFLTCLVDPVLFLLALGVEIAVFQHRQLVFPADLIGDFTQLLVVADFVFELCTVLEGHGIHNKMAVNIVGIQVDGNEHLIPVAPHSSCCFLADSERLLRCDLARFKTLYPMITDDLATQTEPPLYGNHFGIGILLGAVNTANIHFAVGLIIVFSVRERRI